MQEKDTLDLSQKNWVDILVDYRNVLVSVVAIVTVILAALIPWMHTDPSLKSGIDTTSEAYQQYQKFINVFGNDEFLLVVIKNDLGVRDPRVLRCIEHVSSQMEKQANVAEIVSLFTVRLFRKKGGVHGGYPVAEMRNGEAILPDDEELGRLKRALPVMDYLVSDDLKTAGILVRLHEELKFNPEVGKDLVDRAEQLIKESEAPGTEYRIVGATVIRQSIVKYSIQTGIIFGILCMIIATVVSVYIFKSLRVTMLTNVVLAVCVVWILGLMTLFGIPVNATTALSFGFIPIITLEIVIHMVVRYHQFHETCHDKIGAIKQTVRWLARPCFICNATTAVGFGTLMVGSIPMVSQLGFIMSVGIMVSYCLAFILTPAFFVWMKSLDAPDYAGMLRDSLDKVLRGLENSIFRHYRVFVVAGLAIAAFLFAGAPFVRSDIQILRMLSPTTPEIQDIAFVERNLTAISSVELFVQGEPGDFKKPEVWAKLYELEKRLKENPQVVGIDSFLPLLDYLHGLFNPGERPYEGLFSQPQVIPQMIMMTGMSIEGKRIVGRFVNEDFDRLRMSVRMKNSPDVPIGDTIAAIQSTAASVLDGTARVTVTGDLAVFAGQTSQLVTDQIESLFIAAILITILMAIQMNSLTLGLICLIPNIPAVAAVFGIMGWCGISLDGVTVFAATVAIGLAVDNTIHYLTQLKREVMFSGQGKIEDCVRSAYRLTAKQISSYASVTIMGFLALAVSPFRPVVLFGILGFSSLALGLLGDLIFMQSLILWWRPVRNAIVRQIERETKRGKMPEGDHAALSN